MTAPSFLSLTEDQFDEQFGHIQSNDGSFYRDPNWTPEIETAFHERRLWTAVDSGEDDRTFLLSGAHFVNRFAYVIAERPHDSSTDYEVALDD